MRFLVLFISCLFLNSISQAQQLVARNQPALLTNNEQFPGASKLPITYQCGARNYPIDMYRDQIQKKCAWFNSRLPFLRPKPFKSEIFNSDNPGPLYKIPLHLMRRPSKERRPRHRDLAIVTRECIVVGVVATLPKKLSFCDRIRRVCVRKFDYFKCGTI